MPLCADSSRFPEEVRSPSENEKVETVLLEKDKKEKGNNQTKLPGSRPKSCVCESVRISLNCLKPRSRSAKTSFSLASLGRSNGIGEGQAQTLEPIATIDNASIGTSPVMAGVNQLPVSVAADGVHGRKRNLTIAGIDSSPGSIEDMDDNDAREEKRRQPVKRACNECRQQKLRCDVIQDPWTDCSRCRRLRLDCKIESNFKRVGKRSRNAEMEREIMELRKQIATGQPVPGMSQQQALTAGQLTPKQESSQVSPAVYQTPSAMSADQYMGSQEAVASLLDLRSGFDGTNFMRNGGQIRRIEDVMVVPEKVAELFNIFFTYYHPFLPFLDRNQSPDDYNSSSSLLFWTILSVGARRYQGDSNLLNSLAGPVSRLVWSTLADIPQSYHVVKALALLCSWPFPTSSTSTDPTFMLCGMMVQVAMQLGLHRPSHTQDFSKFRVELIEDELRDKVRTWAICNIVAQRVSTGYGQPSSTLYDWTLSSSDSLDPNFKLPEDIRPRLEIEKFCDRVTRALYTNRRDPVGLTSDHERSTMIAFLSRDFEELEEQLKSQNDCITDLFLRAANLHLHLSAFFDEPTTKNYRERVLSLYVATTTFLEVVLNLETEVGPVLSYTPYYVYQMMVAAGCTLLKLCKSFFASHIDMEYTKNLFNRTIWAIRGVSASSNDLPERLAEVLAQMWRLGGATQRANNSTDVDDSLRLKVRCRMSMSLLFDSVWRWREDARTKGRNIEAYLKNPTNPDSAADSSATSSVGPVHTSTITPGMSGNDPSLAPAPLLSQASLGIQPSATQPNGLPSGFIEPNYEVFDPLNWLLDGLVDLPYSYSTVGGMESQGIA